jgi:hypothetical protein
LSQAWNVRGIPTVFIVDQEGHIVSARGDLDEVIPKLLDGERQGRARKGKSG